MDSWYQLRAVELFRDIIREYEIVLDKKVEVIRVKKMTTRWGSCNSKKAYINLNQELIKKPIGSIRYVILHELAHLTYPNHSKEFYQYIQRLMPDFKIHHKNLSR
jgi:predicted metal-dependent hydrolase